MTCETPQLICFNEGNFMFSWSFSFELQQSYRYILRNHKMDDSQLVKQSSVLEDVATFLRLS